MYCLGGVTESSTMTTMSTSPLGSMSANREGILSVIRALGVLVCEGRIQGSPRGYREGPHCAAPLQSPINQHNCKKDDYMCNRYVILVKEIADRTAMGTSLCVEVFMCSDCPCGLATATCNDPVSSSIPSTLLQWSNTSEIVLEYWCIKIVSSKNSETMNIQGLYQAVRSRLHFSQIAAWWSRSNGTKPSYISTRIVNNNQDNLRKFRETPIKHTFPLASIGDGNSVEVTLWALPRLEDVPELLCTIHQSIAVVNNDDDNVACALTPSTTALTAITTAATATTTTSSSASFLTLNNGNNDNANMILPIIVDDRLQTSCEQSGKHHCHCEDEESSPPSPSIKLNGERKRRRSLPCGPSDQTTPSTSNFGNNNLLSSVSEVNSTNNNNIIDKNDDSNIYYDDNNIMNDKLTSDNLNYIILNNHDKYSTINYQSNNDDNDDNNEKRYKPSSEACIHFETLKLTNDNQLLNNTNNNNIDKLKTNVIVNPFYSTINNPGPSNYNNNNQLTPCNVHNKIIKKPQDIIENNNNINKNNNEKKLILPSGEITHLMSKLSFPKDKTKKYIKDEVGIIDWISKVPNRVLNVNNNNNNDKCIEQDKNKKFNSNNCNLELSQREFNEVLAVLRTKTTSSKRRTPVKNQRKKDKYQFDEQINIKNSTINNINKQNKNNIKTNTIINYKNNNNNDTILCEKNDNKADILLGAILRVNDRKGLSDISNGKCTITSNSIDSTSTSTSTSTITSSSSTTNDDDDGGDDDDDDDDKQRQLLSLKIKPLDDEKFLPSVINKPLLRIKKLFKKEQEPKIYTDISQDDDDDDDDDGNAKHDLRKLKKNNNINNTVKRKIDFADFNIAYEPLVNDTNNNNNKTDEKKMNKYGCETMINNNDDNDDEDDDEDDEDVIDKVDNVYYDDDINDRNVPSVIEQEKFRRSLENAASMVFHSRTGLPLTSSPAPLRRGHCCFDYDSSLNTVSSKRSAIFELNTPPSPGAVSLEETDREVDNICYNNDNKLKKRSLSSRIRPQSHALLGNFEESALNGRLEPVSTVHGFTADIGASGSFCPKHRKLPVTVFFYTLGDNDKVSTPYLAHINLEKKGYQVPRSGTIQVTLLNPLGTVVKMFVVLYDLSDMPPRSHTFLRQRTLRDKTLRYLIHLRFMSGKSGRIYLHTDIRIIICRKSDVDTASDFGLEPQKELRSYIHGPTNPKFSPRC
ncbi:protein FAM214A [Aphidius gifuensis]|nr:protein FAM214A [Aphidius gifuensis]XP_044008637.1 protein FAM214A [Aphidius gifuensis]